PARAARHARRRARRPVRLRRAARQDRPRRVSHRARPTRPDPHRRPLRHGTPMSILESSSLTTRAVRAGIATDQEHGAVVPPLHLSSTFAFRGFAQPRRFDYTRSGNPTRTHLADALASLEGGELGVVTSTGMSR